jgi:hypothetical protein
MDAEQADIHYSGKLKIMDIISVFMVANINFCWWHQSAVYCLVYYFINIVGKTLGLSPI